MYVPACCNVYPTECEKSTEFATYASARSFTTTWPFETPGLRDVAHVTLAVYDTSARLLASVSAFPCVSFGTALTFRLDPAAMTADTPEPVTADVDAAIGVAGATTTGGTHTSPVVLLTAVCDTHSWTPPIVMRTSYVPVVVSVTAAVWPNPAPTPSNVLVTAAVAAIPPPPPRRAYVTTSAAAGDSVATFPCVSLKSTPKLIVSPAMKSYDVGGGFGSCAAPAGGDVPLLYALVVNPARVPFSWFTGAPPPIAIVSGAEVIRTSSNTTLTSYDPAFVLLNEKCRSRVLRSTLETVSCSYAAAAPVGATPLTPRYRSFAATPPCMVTPSYRSHTLLAASAATSRSKSKSAEDLIRNTAESPATNVAGRITS